MGRRVLAWWSARKHSDRLRAVGWIVVACGVAGAAVFYWAKTRVGDPALDDVNALGYQRSLQHGMGVMMGTFGLILTEWQQALTSPLGETLAILAATALVAGYFFRVAWVIDENEKDRA